MISWCVWIQRKLKLGLFLYSAQTARHPRHQNCAWEILQRGKLYHKYDSQVRSTSEVNTCIDVAEICISPSHKWHSFIAIFGFHFKQYNVTHECMRTSVNIIYQWTYTELQCHSSGSKRVMTTWCQVLLLARKTHQVSEQLSVRFSLAVYIFHIVLFSCHVLFIHK